MVEIDEALETYRKLVSLLYREIGAMHRNNHPELHDGSTLALSGFAAQRKNRAREIYCESRADQNPDAIADRYRRETGLSLEQVHEAFRDGDWLLGRTKHSFGGPKWAEIAEVAVDLRNSLRDGDPAAAGLLIKQVGALHHNNGQLADKFVELTCN